MLQSLGISVVLVMMGLSLWMLGASGAPRLANPYMLLMLVVVVFFVGVGKLKSD